MADVSITAANVVKSTTSSTDRGTAGATITAGQPLYKDANNAYVLKPAIGTSQAAAACVGVSLHGASTGQPVEYTTDGPYTAGGTLTVGQVYAVSAGAAGGIAPYSDLASTNYVTILGVATTAALLKLRINVSGIAKP
jgi:hypothetical protein